MDSSMTLPQNTSKTLPSPLANVHCLKLQNFSHCWLHLHDSGLLCSQHGLHPSFASLLPQLPWTPSYSVGKVTLLFCSQMYLSRVVSAQDVPVAQVFTHHVCLQRSHLGDIAHREEKLITFLGAIIPHLAADTLPPLTTASNSRSDMLSNASQSNGYLMEVFVDFSRINLNASLKTDTST